VKAQRFAAWFFKYLLLSFPLSVLAAVAVQLDLITLNPELTSLPLATVGGFLVAVTFLSPLVRYPHAPVFVVAYILLVATLVCTWLLHYGPSTLGISIVGLMWIHYRIYLYYPVAILSVWVLRRYAGVPLRDRAISVAEAERILEGRR